MIASQVREYDGLTFQGTCEIRRVGVEELRTRCLHLWMPWPALLLADVAKKGLKYGDEDDEASKADKEVAYKPLADFLKAKLGEFVKEGECNCSHSETLAHCLASSLTLDDMLTLSPFDLDTHSRALHQVDDVTLCHRG